MSTLPSTSWPCWLFDLDGVLVKSEEVWFRLVEESGRRFRGRPVTREEFAPTFGQGTRADVELFGLSCSPEELDRFYVENFSRYGDHVWTNPEAAPLLRILRQQGKRLAVVTNTVTPLAREILTAARLLEHFDFLACADQVPHAKPAPDLVLHALRGLGAQASEACLIGDSRYDREAAQGAAVDFIGLGIPGGHRTVAALSELP